MTITPTRNRGPQVVEEPVLELSQLSVTFTLRRQGFYGPKPRLRAVDGVDLRIAANETVALVGESGSGKSTLGRAALNLLGDPNARLSGDVRFDGRVVSGRVAKAGLRHLRRHAGIVFQNPYSSLDPRMRVRDIVAEPLDWHESPTRAERAEQVAQVLDQVGIDPEHGDRYATEFSGGQRQRIAIARAVILRPRLLVLDECTSALDVSTQSQIVDLLDRLKAELGMAYLFIAHDLALVQTVSQRVAVMYLGRIVEEGPTGRVFADPQHPYTRALLDSVPRPHPASRRLRDYKVSDVLPDPTRPPSGCRFHPRCLVAIEQCSSVDPAETVAHDVGRASCHLLVTDPATAVRPSHRERSSGGLS